MICYQLYVILKILMCISKNSEFLKDYANRAGDKLKLPKWESPAGIGRVCMSVTAASEVAHEIEKSKKMLIKGFDSR